MTTSRKRKISFFKGDLLDRDPVRSDRYYFDHRFRHMGDLRRRQPAPDSIFTYRSFEGNTLLLVRCLMLICGSAATVWLGRQAFGCAYAGERRLGFFLFGGSLATGILAGFAEGLAETFFGADLFPKTAAAAISTVAWTPIKIGMIAILYPLFFALLNADAMMQDRPIVLPLLLHRLTL